MAGFGSPDLNVADMSGRNVAIVASSWYTEVMDGLIDGARRAIEESGAIATVYRVPGSYELPLGVARVFDAGADAAVALGVVIRGGTPHFDYVCDAATMGLTNIALQARKPVGFGLLTCDNEQQAIDRAGLEGSREDKGYEAGKAALAMIDFPPVTA